MQVYISAQLQRSRGGWIPAPPKKSKEKKKKGHLTFILLGENGKHCANRIQEVKPLDLSDTLSVF